MFALLALACWIWGMGTGTRRLLQTVSCTEVVSRQTSQKYKFRAVSSSFDWRKSEHFPKGWNVPILWQADYANWDGPSYLGCRKHLWTFLDSSDELLSMFLLKPRDLDLSQGNRWDHTVVLYIESFLHPEYGPTLNIDRTWSLMVGPSIYSYLGL